METGAEKKPRRKNRNRQKAPDPDIELAEVESEKVETVPPKKEDTDKTWVETENSATEVKTKRQKKKSKKKKNKDDKNEDIEIVAEVVANEEKGENEEVKKDEEAASEEPKSETVVSKKKIFGRISDGFKMWKKKSESVDKKEDDKGKATPESVVEKTEKNEIKPKEPEEELNDEEKSEAENVFHELPSASSVERKEELGKKLSAKEKLKQKLDKKKSSEREPASASRLLRHLSTQSSRLEDRLKEEDQDAQMAFDRHDVVMKKKREYKEDGITAQDAYDFFTATWDDTVIDLDVKKEEKEKIKDVAKNAEDKEDDEDNEEGYETANDDLDDNDEKRLYSKDYIGSEYVWEITDWQGQELPQIRFEKFKIS